MGLRVLGVDPGSVTTGFAVLESVGRNLKVLDCGSLRLGKSVSGDLRGFADRLNLLQSQLSEVIQTHQPSVMAVERIFFAKNVRSALQLGHARGVVLLCGAQAGIDLAEYTPTEIKQRVTGQGRADKQQVERMVSLLTGHRDFPTADASDALAIALCHAQSASAHQAKLPKRSRRGSLKDLVQLD